MKYSMCSAHDLCNSLSHTKFIRTHTTHTTVTSLIQTYQKYRFAFYITYTHIIHSLHTYTSHTEEGGVKKPNSNHSNIIYWNQNQSHWFHIHLSTLLLLFFFSLVSSLNLTIFFFWFFFIHFSFFLYQPHSISSHEIIRNSTWLKIKIKHATITLYHTFLWYLHSEMVKYFKRGRETGVFCVFQYCCCVLNIFWW